MRERSGGMMILAVSIVAGLAAALLAVGFLRGVVKTTTVLVANQEIAAFTPLTPAMFTAQKMPSAAVSADAVTDATTLTGRYARTMLLPGTVVRTGHLAVFTGNAGPLSAQLTETGRPGLRALAIPVDNTTAVGGTIQPGDRVDVIAAVRIERQSGPSTTFSKIIARGLPVLHRTEADGSAKGTVVVQVTLEQAEEIAYAQLAGTIYLATVPYRTETEAEPTPGVTPDSFIQRHGGQ